MSEIVVRCSVDWRKARVESPCGFIQTEELNRVAASLLFGALLGRVVAFEGQHDA